MPSFFPNPSCLLGSGNAFMIFPQTKGRFTGQRKLGRKSSLCFPTQLKFTSERLQGTKRSPDNLLPKFKRFFFLHIYQKCSSANNSGERPHLAASVWPPEDPISALWQKKATKDPLNDSTSVSEAAQLRDPHHRDWSALLEGQKPALNLPPEANTGMFTQDSWWRNFAGTLLMWKRFYLLCSDKTGFGLQLRVHFSESFKGKE